VIQLAQPPASNEIIFRAVEYVSSDLARFKHDFSSAYSRSLPEPNTRVVIDGNLTREQQAVADSLVARRNKEARLGTQSFLRDVKATFRGNSCSCLKRHSIGCVRQVIGFAELMANRDPDRFIWPTMKAWSRVAKKKDSNEIYSSRQIGRCLVLLEVNHWMLPTKIFRRGKLRSGWIVARHEDITTIQEDRCVFRNPPVEYRISPRTRGQRLVPSSGPQGNHKGATWEPHGVDADVISREPDVILSRPDVNSDVITDVISDVISKNHDVISDTRKTLMQVELEGGESRNTDASPVSPVSPISPVEESPVEESLATNENQNPHPSALSNQNLDSDPDQTETLGQGKTIGSVLRGADIQYLSDREFDESFTTNYPHQAELVRCVEDTIEALGDEPYLGRVSNARVMGDAMGLLLARHDHKAPEGWYPAMRKLRTNPHCNCAFDNKDPDTVAELVRRLHPPESPYWYLTNKFITDLEEQLLVRLSTADHDAHPELYTYNAQRAEQQFKGQLAAQREEGESADAPRPTSYWHGKQARPVTMF
jgi:hypothetical protein